MNFYELWTNACKEDRSDPNGAAGDLMAALADHLDVEQVQYDQIGDSAIFLLDLGSLGFRGMDINVVTVSHPPENESQAREQKSILQNYKRAARLVGFYINILLSPINHNEQMFLPIMMLSRSIRKIYVVYFYPRLLRQPYLRCLNARLIWKAYARLIPRRRLAVQCLKAASENSIC